MHLFELAVDLALPAEGHALPAEGHRATRARAGRSEPEGQGGLRQGQEDGGGREQQAAEQQAGSQRAGAMRVCRAGRGRGPGQRAAERGQAPEETREAAPVPRGLLQGPGRWSFPHFFLGSGQW